MGQQSSVRALERGLDIVQLLNRHNGLTVTQVGLNPVVTVAGATRAAARAA